VKVSFNSQVTAFGTEISAYLERKSQYDCDEDEGGARERDGFVVHFF